MSSETKQGGFGCAFPEIHSFLKSMHASWENSPGQNEGFGHAGESTGLQRSAGG